ncbi:glycosyltransferase family 4 protein [Kineococcus rhizosphaerae]|uniref:Glycosyltransferase involved in cell wall biosynthesis n=1 Tax=Kineococcus rhizosphaerae TaxID=559628 RepID=A0A2T0R4I0_9ACTN|nr:glycosyltransferase family 4 protein [Kineococcus rhizosphaerae]PRY15265.1 glycosyltransferase involved in cell wall biosynthesis [Kineococcus rhizosphaerae]
MSIDPGTRPLTEAVPFPLQGKRVLLLNWRDRTHPLAGGAEVYTWNIGERLVAGGSEVTVFTARHAGSARTGLDRGMRVVRGGGTFGVYLAAAWFLLRHRRRFDAVVDFQNGIPFFAPLFAGRRRAVVVVVHHVHTEQFALHFSPLFSRIGQFLEGPASRRVYGRRPVVAVSPSTRRDVRRRLKLRGPIHVVPNGTAARPTVPAGARSPFPHVVVVSRLVSHKRFDLLLEAVPDLLATHPDLRVDIAGDGPDRAALQARAAELGLDDVVTFHGFVSAEQREQLLAAGWVTAAPSQAEGWGLTVVEANAAGVPAVAFDVPGLRDSVVHGRTGWIVPTGTPLAAGLDHALRELADPRTAGSMADRCRTWAGSFSWETSAERLAGVVAGEIDARRSRSRREASDLSVRVEADLRGFSGDVDALLTRLPQVLRRSDEWVVDGHTLQVLLHGCDQAVASEVMDRLGLALCSRMRLATSSDLLTGAR